MRKKTFLIPLTCLGIALSVALNVWLPTPKYGIRINQTASLPHKVFLSVRLDAQPITRGSIISFPHLTSPIPLAKEVRGVPGDKIAFSDDHVLLNGDDLGQVLEFSPSGRVLTPIAPGVIPEGHVFVHSHHLLSYDSRYAELGLIPIDAIREVLWPIF